MPPGTSCGCGWPRSEAWPWAWPRWGGPCRPWTGGEKKSVHAAGRDTERVRALRAAFVEAVQTEDSARLDETSTNLTYCRRYARAECEHHAPTRPDTPRHAPTRPGTARHGGPDVTLVAALTPSGLQAAMAVSEAVNGDVFAAYLQQALGLTLMPGDVVVPDNLPAHKAAGLAERVAARGTRLLTCHRTRPILTPSDWPSTSSKRGCARLRPAPGRPWKQSFRLPPTG